MFNVTRDTKEIYIGSAYKNQNKNRNTSYIKPKKEDEEPKPIKLVTKEISLTVQRRRQELKLSQKDLAMKINKNVCKNKIISNDDFSIMLQATSIYTQGNGKHWQEDEMLRIMLDIAKTSLQMLGRDLFKQLTTFQTDRGDKDGKKV